MTVNYAKSVCVWLTVNYAKPVVTREPASQKALRFGNITMVCEAASSSNSVLAIRWKKENQVHSR